MSQTQSRLKGDRIVESLERGEHWFTQHWVKLAIFAGVFIISVFAAEAWNTHQDEVQATLWNEASKLTEIQDKMAFISANPEADATPFLMLQTSRQLLEEKRYVEAEKLSADFVVSHDSHPRLSSALMIRAYAREEQGKFEEAKSDYQKIQALEDKVNQLLSTQALTRLP